MDKELLKAFSSENFGRYSVAEIDQQVNGSLHAEEARVIETGATEPVEAILPGTTDLTKPELPLNEGVSFSRILSQVRQENPAGAKTVDPHNLKSANTKKGYEKKHKLRKLAVAATLGMTALTAAGCGLLQSSSPRTSHGAKITLESKKTDNFNNVKLTDVIPASWTTGAFFPPDYTNPSKNIKPWQIASNRVKSWLTNSPLFNVKGKKPTVTESLAFAEMIAEEALGQNGFVADVPNYPGEYNALYSKLIAPNGTKNAANFLKKVSAVLPAMESSTSNFSGTSYVELQENPKGVLREVQITNTTEINNIEQGKVPGVVFGSPNQGSTIINGKRVMLHSISPIEVTQNGTVITEGVIQANGITNENGASNNQQNQVSAANASTSVANPQGGSVTTGSANTGSSGGGGTGTEAGSGSTGSSGGGGNTGETGGSTGTSGTGTGTGGGGGSGETPPPTTTTPPEKPGDPGSTATSNDGAISDPNNAGGSSDASNLGTVGLAQ